MSMEPSTACSACGEWGIWFVSSASLSAMMSPPFRKAVGCYFSSMTSTYTVPLTS